jgi:hypothetical protein
MILPLRLGKHLQQVCDQYSSNFFSLAQLVNTSRSVRLRTFNLELTNLMEISILVKKQAFVGQPPLGLALKGLAYVRVNQFTYKTFR